MARMMQGRALVAGEAAGQLLYSDAPLSFWGGYDAVSGEIIDRRHPLSGQIAAARVLAIPFTKGSSTTTAVFLEAVRAGAAPAAVLTAAPDAFLSLASIVADEMYGRPVPVVALEVEDFASLAEGGMATIRSDGVVMIEQLATDVPAATGQDMVRDAMGSGRDVDDGGTFG